MPVKNLAKLAKRNGGGAAKGSSIAKQETKKRPPVVKVITPEEERKLKIKETVDSLLDHVNLGNPNEKKEVVVEPEEVTTVQREATTWLEEQIEQLTEDNNRLSGELADTKQAYDDLYNGMQQYQNTGMMPSSFGDGETKRKLIEEFRLIQNNLLTMGVNPQTQQPNLIIRPVEFLLRLCMIFDFLQNEKKF